MTFCMFRWRLLVCLRILVFRHGASAHSFPMVIASPKHQGRISNWQKAAGDSGAYETCSRTVRNVFMQLAWCNPRNAFPLCCWWQMTNLGSVVAGHASKAEAESDPVPKLKPRPVLTKFSALPIASVATCIDYHVLIRAHGMALKHIGVEKGVPRT